jgi:molybdate transport system substrate-binding protein
MPSHATLGLLALATLLPACRDPAAERTLTVSAAASLSGAFTDLGRRFERAHPGKRVRFSFAASGLIATQAIQGAPVDVVALASDVDLRRIDRAGRLVAGSTRAFAANALVVVTPRKGGTPVASAGDLRGVGRVAIGNPATVPAGRYARQWLERAQVWGALRPSLVLGEHVRQVLDYAARGEVGAAVVFETDQAARAGALRLALRVPADQHDPIVYPAALVAGTRKPALARRFIDLLLSNEGQRLLRSHGFRPAPSR